MQGNVAAAEMLLRQHLASAPGSPRIQAALGNLLSEGGALIDGEHFLRLALAQDRSLALIASLGYNLLRQGRGAEAEPLLRDLTHGLPDELLPRLYLASALEWQDRFDEALAVLAAAEPIARQQGQSTAVRRGLVLGRTADWRQGLALLDATDTLSGEEHLARGRLRDRARRYGDAWADFERGKRLIAQETGAVYPADAIAAHVGQLQRAFTGRNWRSLPTAKVSRTGSRPIFVFGFPRSGTTLLEGRLAAHPAIRAAGELPFAAELPMLVANTLGSYPDGLLSAPTERKQSAADALREHYLARAQAQGVVRKADDWFVDKMPLNELYLPLLALAFPDGVFFHLTRHPLDTLVSMMGHHMTHGFHCGVDLQSAARHLALMSEVIEAWQHAGIPFVPLQYEDLAENPGDTLARAFAAIGLAPPAGAAASPRPVAATPSRDQVRAPISTAAIGRWRHYADPLAPVMPIVERVMARGGYTA